MSRVARSWSGLEPPSVERDMVQTPRRTPRQTPRQTPRDRAVRMAPALTRDRGSRSAIPTWMRHTLLAQQHYQCANAPASKHRQKHALFASYECPLWKCNRGYFDAAGYVIDHRVPYHRVRQHTVENLQALCHSCHAWKTTFERSEEGKKVCH